MAETLICMLVEFSKSWDCPEMEFYFEKNMEYTHSYLYNMIMWEHLH